jgi:hypothetical protein
MFLNKTLLCTKTVKHKHILFREIHRNMHSMGEEHSWALTGYSHHTDRTQTDTGNRIWGTLVLITANMVEGGRCYHSDSSYYAWRKTHQCQHQDLESMCTCNLSMQTPGSIIALLTRYRTCIFIETGCGEGVSPQQSSATMAGNILQLFFKYRIFR